MVGTDAPAIEVVDVTHFFEVPGQGPTQAVERVSFEVAPGEFVAIVGPSGCGKTTVLNMIAGLLRPSSGTVRIGGQPVAGIRLDVGYMFARDGLLPWRSALDNAAFGLELRGMPSGARAMRARELLGLVGLEGFEQHLRSQLSQGMRQRVAIARTLATDPTMLLMDEPFGALDAQTKMILEDEFIKLWEGTGKTVVFVTHDLVEAITMADRVLVFSARPGRIKGDHRVGLPRPRSATELRLDPAFQEIYAKIWGTLRYEVREGRS